MKPGISCPLVIPALFFAGGIVCARHGPVLPEYLAYGVLATGIAVTCYLLYRQSTSTLQTISIALAFFVTGNANLARVSQPVIDPQLKEIAEANLEAVLTGIIQTAPSFNGSKGKFIFVADGLRNVDGSSTPIAGRILIKTNFPPPDELAPGDRLILRAALAIPTEPGTPGTFNYRRYLLDRKIALTGFIRSAAYLNNYSFSTTGHRPARQYLPQFLRHKTNLFIDRANLSNNLSGLYKAIITGQQDSVPIWVLNNFRRSGAIHLLAISGMHMGLLALLCGLLINFGLRQSSRLLLRWPVWKISAIASLLVMGCYATVSGLQPPVLRAFIMAAMVIFAIVLDRPRSMLNILALAALLILFYDPTALFSASFQLSFSAVTAIILCHHRFPDLFQISREEKAWPARLCHWLRSGLLISLVALLATAPITIYHFHQVSFLGPVTTLITAPLICFWALPLGLAAALTSSWFAGFAAILLTVGSYGLVAADLATSVIAKFPHATRTLPPPLLITIAIYYLLAGYLLLFETGRSVKFTALLVMLLIIGSPIPASISDRHGDEETRVTFIDVGQGSSTLLELPGNNNILVDGGGAYSPRFNPGEQIIGPFLWHKSITRLRALIISHKHHDHFNGLEFIVKNFRPEQIWINGFAGATEEYQGILAAAAEIGSEVKVPEKGAIIFAEGAAKLTSISDLHLRTNPDLPENSRSLIIRLAVGENRIILPGDIMADDGRILLNQGVDLQSEVLAAPHHGSSNSAGHLLVEKGAPDWLVVSASPFMAAYFPDPDFVEWCEARGTRVLNTAKHGTLTFNFGENGGINWQPVSGKGSNH